MANQEQILAALKGCSAQSPLAFGELIKKTGIDAGPLMEALQDLFDARVINRCTVTREDRVQVVVWPTGVLMKRAFGQFAINPNKAVSAEYRPAEEKNSIQKQEQPIMEQTKSKARLMIELLLAKGSATGKELTAHSGTSSVKPFLKGCIEKGLIEVDDSHSVKVYSIAPGVKSGDFAPAQGKRAASISAATSPVEAAPSAQVGVQPSAFDPLPQIFRAPAAKPDPAPVAPVPPATKTLTIEDIPSYLPRQQETTQQEAPVKPRFRVAITSDQTMLLFGLGLEPIELDREQATLLVEFVSDKSEILCA